MYRILSLDGGGIRGLITAVFLRRLENDVPGWIDEVDLVAGTSTGAVIAIALAQGVATDEIVQFYYQFGSEVFTKPRLGNLLKLKKMIRSKYDTHILSETLKRAFGDTRLCDLKKKILIATFDLDNDRNNPTERCWEPKFFHNLGNGKGSERLEVYRAALYSCATPVYLPSVDGFIDGAVTAQNPSLVALAHAQDESLNGPEQPAFEDIVLLSIGTGKVSRFVEGSRHNWGYLQWTHVLVDMMLEGSVDLVDRICQPLLKGRYHRLCPLLPHTIHADDWRRRDELIDIGEQTDLQDTVEWLRGGWTS